MKNNLRNKKSPFLNRKYFIILVVCITTGFIIGYSYNLSKEKKIISSPSPYYQQENTYWQELIEQQERNKELMEELSKLENKIRSYEKEFASNEEQYEQYIIEAERLRLLLGTTVGEGEGIKLTLEDGEYDSTSTNPNEYIVHDSHIFKVINELKIAGAEAISINGQRLKANSYISCNGPVITVDDKQYPAPFVIEAVGKQSTLIASLELEGGVFDQLLNERVIVTLEKSDKIQMPSVNKEN